MFTSNAWAPTGCSARCARFVVQVIFVSSGGQYTEHLEVEDLQGEKLRKYDGAVLYARDKRRQVGTARRCSRAGFAC